MVEERNGSRVQGDQIKLESKKIRCLLSNFLWTLNKHHRNFTLASYFSVYFQHMKFICMHKTLVFLQLTAFDIPWAGESSFFRGDKNNIPQIRWPECTKVQIQFLRIVLLVDFVLSDDTQKIYLESLVWWRGSWEVNETSPAFVKLGCARYPEIWIVFQWTHKNLEFRRHRMWSLNRRLQC